MAASVASAYARAFADVVVDTGLDPAKAIAELRTITALLDESSDLRKVWENPAIPGAQKRGILDALVGRSGLSRPVRNLLAVLIDHRRTHFVDAIAQQFEKDLNERMGFAEAGISSARDLSSAEKAALEAQVARLTNRKVKAKYVQDASLLGGAVVRVGSTIYDGSVKGRLAKIREAISS